MVPDYDQMAWFGRSFGRIGLSAGLKGAAVIRKGSTISSSPPAWHDRFNVPTVPRLRESLPASTRSTFDNLLAKLREIEGISESLAWHGECWRWTIEFRATAPGRSAARTEALAVIVPNPADLQLAIPMSRDFAQSLPVKRMKSALREGLELAKEPFDSHWGVWSITSKNLIDDLQDLVELKLRHLTRKAV